MDILQYFFAFGFSYLLTYLILKIHNFKLKHYIASPIGPQKIHSGTIPRLGGLSIFLTMGIFSVYNLHYNSYEQNFFALFFISSIPVFVSGFLDDITQSIKPKIRLLASFGTACIAVILLDIHIYSINLNLIDLYLQNKFISFFFTILCIVFIIQAFNILDGLNGLSLGTGILCLFSSVIIAYKIDYLELIVLLYCLIFIKLGVLFFNFPLGKIFLGDGGAYIIGLYISLSVLLLYKESDEIYSFVIVLILLYPSYELLRTFTRRIFVDKSSIFKPDKKHLHSLLYRLNSLKNYSKIKSNNLTSLQILLIQLFNFVYVMSFYENDLMIFLGILWFIIIYEFLYFYISYKLKKNIKTVTN